MDQVVQQMIREGIVEVIESDVEPRFRITEKGMKLLGTIKREHPEEFEKMARDMGWLHNVH